MALQKSHSRIPQHRRVGAVRTSRPSTVIGLAVVTLAGAMSLYATPSAPSGRGVAAQDELVALRDAAERGDAASEFKLGVKYATGDGVPTNDSLAADWLRKAAQQGYVDAEYNLGLMYADGNGVPQDSAQALVWLRKAADHGDPRAESNLGLMYANGSEIGRASCRERV